VLARADDAALHTGGDPATVGLRSPAHPLVRELCTLVGPLATTSANRHGEPPCTTAADLSALFGEELLVLDGGRCEGEPSTVVSLAAGSATLLRNGPVSLEAVTAALAAGGILGGAR
jgi:tRNA A37 threonylcarbamoyladenosine synthetase subunit TsaC/SUA5/YrdC